MIKYVFSWLDDGNADDEIYDTLKEAYDVASYRWAHLTKEERKRHDVFEVCCVECDEETFAAFSDPDSGELVSNYVTETVYDWIRFNISIKTFNSNWEVYRVTIDTDNGLAISIPTSADDINSDIYYDMEDVIEMLTDKIKDAGCFLSEKDIAAIRRNAENLFYDRF